MKFASVSVSANACPARLRICLSAGVSLQYVCATLHPCGDGLHLPVVINTVGLVFSWMPGMRMWFTHRSWLNLLKAA